jgi:hypothetical protein
MATIFDVGRSMLSSAIAIGVRVFVKCPSQVEKRRKRHEGADGRITRTPM